MEQYLEQYSYFKELAQLCEGVKQKHHTLDLEDFSFYVLDMFIRYCETKESTATPLQAKKGFLTLPGTGKQLILACIYISANMQEYPISYHDLYSISHVDRNTIRKCERDIREALLL